MKKIISVALFAVVVASVVGCGSPSVKKDATYNEGDALPYEVTGPSGDQVSIEDGSDGVPPDETFTITTALDRLSENRAESDAVLKPSSGEASNDIPAMQSKNSPDNYLPGVLIVGYKTSDLDKPTQALDALFGGIEIVEEFEFIRSRLIRLKSGISVPDAVALFERSRYSTRELDLIEYVHPEYYQYGSIVPNDPGYEQQWNMDTIHAPQAWDIETGSRDVIVAVIDSGIRADHPDLADNIWHNENGLWGFDFVNRDSDPTDDLGHGTMVSGVIGGRGNNSIGVAGIDWNASMVSLKVLGWDGLGLPGDEINAIYAATDQIGNGAKIINLSLGRVGDKLPAEEKALRYANDRGVLIVIAAGNDGANNDGTPTVYPASYDVDNIISVAATDKNDQMPSSSNYGPNSVDIAAPGVGIVTTSYGVDYKSANGTSVSAPHVAGAAALVWSHWPQLSHLQVKEQILDSADSLPSLQGRIAGGRRLNLEKALSNPPVERALLTLSINQVVYSPGDMLVLEYQLKPNAFEAYLTDAYLYSESPGEGGFTFWYYNNQVLTPTPVPMPIATAIPILNSSGPVIPPISLSQAPLGDYKIYGLLVQSGTSPANLNNEDIWLSNKATAAFSLIPSNKTGRRSEILKSQLADVTLKSDKASINPGEGVSISYSVHPNTYDRSYAHAYVAVKSPDSSIRFFDSNFGRHADPVPFASDARIVRRENELLLSWQPTGDDPSGVYTLYAFFSAEDKPVTIGNQPSAISSWLGLIDPYRVSNLASVEVRVEEPGRANILIDYARAVNGQIEAGVRTEGNGKLDKDAYICAVAKSGAWSGKAGCFDGQGGFHVNELIKFYSGKIVNYSVAGRTPLVPTGNYLILAGLFDPGTSAADVLALKGQVVSKEVYVDSPAPRIDRLDPQSVGAGWSGIVHILGSNFVNGAQVLVNGGVYPCGFANSGQIDCALGNVQGGSYSVQVKNPDGQISNGTTFSVGEKLQPSPPQLPTIDLKDLRYDVNGTLVTLHWNYDIRANGYAGTLAKVCGIGCVDYWDDDDEDWKVKKLGPACTGEWPLSNLSGALPDISQDNARGFRAVGAIIRAADDPNNPVNWIVRDQETIGQAPDPCW